ncbi:hypothetical protein [uncultured Roseibium sp.]|uniref:hypothetical protein n=1 Tax=uncultured Roseibium sp. TaxID=1936171 RepID=UPI00262F0139|nr:hypothetical protein [uncultured Roseibium sp.]
MTRVSIDGEKFLIDGTPTHKGRTWKGHQVEGLLFNNRVVQAIFDDENPETRHQWVYPDTGVWDPERNLEEFCAVLPEYKANGCDAVTINLQGGMPITKTETVQPWLNTAIDPEGNLKSAYLHRLDRLLKAADIAGVVVIVGLYYFGQDKYISDEDAVKRGVINACDWLLKSGHENILVEINNEADIPHYTHDVLMPGRVHELIALAKSRSLEGRRLLVATSFAGGAYHMRHNGVLDLSDSNGLQNGIPTEDVLEVSDFALVHTNEMNMANTREVVRRTREREAFKRCPMPVVINEDSIAVTNLFAAVEEYAPWGYYDQGDNNYRDGYQSVPVNWAINTPSKRSFFDAVAEVTGAKSR